MLDFDKHYKSLLSMVSYLSKLSFEVALKYPDNEFFDSLQSVLTDSIDSLNDAVLYLDQAMEINA